MKQQEALKWSLKATKKTLSYWIKSDKNQGDQMRWCKNCQRFTKKAQITKYSPLKKPNRPSKKVPVSSIQAKRSTKNNRFGASAPTLVTLIKIYVISYEYVQTQSNFWRWGDGQPFRYRIANTFLKDQLKSCFKVAVKNINDSLKIIISKVVNWIIQFQIQIK